MYVPSITTVTLDGEDTSIPAPTCAPREHGRAGVDDDAQAADDAMIEQGLSMSQLTQAAMVHVHGHQHDYAHLPRQRNAVAALRLHAFQLAVLAVQAGDGAGGSKTALVPTSNPGGSPPHSVIPPMPTPSRVSTDGRAASARASRRPDLLHPEQMLCL